MATWEYATLMMGTPDRKGRRWQLVSSDPKTPAAKQVGKAEKPAFVGRVWQGARLLDSAAQKMADEGWELVSHSFSGVIFGFYGIAVFRRSIRETKAELET